MGRFKSVQTRLFDAYDYLTLDYSAVSAHALKRVQRRRFPIWRSLIGDQHIALIRLADERSKQRDLSMGRFCAAFRLYHWLSSMLGAWAVERIKAIDSMSGQDALNSGQGALKPRNNQRLLYISQDNASLYIIVHYNIYYKMGTSSSIWRCPLDKLLFTKSFCFCLFFYVHSRTNSWFSWWFS